MRIFFLILLITLQSAHADIRFLSISDIHFGDNIATKVGRDTNQALLTKALNQFSQLTSNADFILLLGDLPAHFLRSSTKKRAYINTVFHDLYTADHANKPMFYVTGNNDSLQGNAQPFSAKGESPITLATDWQGACIHCKGLIIDGLHMRDKGYYSSYVLQNNKDVILIALNSVQFMKLPFYVPQYPHQNEDARQQLQWLKTQLKTHHAKQLFIAMHTPPGTDYKGKALWHSIYLTEFIQILGQFHQQYEEINVLTSHTHMDDIRKIRLKNGAVIYAYATPSISPTHHNNPAMKVFDLNKNFKISNYTTYYTTTGLTWGNKHYQARKDLFPQCHHPKLATCLNLYNNEALCKILKEGQFYGVKSLSVDASVCNITYPVN